MQQQATKQPTKQAMKRMANKVARYEVTRARVPQYFYCIAPQHFLEYSLLVSSNCSLDIGIVPAP